MDEIKSWNREKTGILLRLLCIISTVIVIYTILTKGQAVIHSDTATATLLAQAQLKYHSFFPKSWCYANGDVWVLSSNLFVMPFSALIKDQSLSRMLGSALMVICSSIMTPLFGKYYLKSKSWMICIPAVFLFCYGLYDFVLFQASHTLLIAWMQLMIWLCYEMLYGKNKRICFALFAILSLLFALGGIKVFNEFIIPLLCAVIILYYLELPKDKYDICSIIRSLMSVTVKLSVFAGVGYIIYKVYLCSNKTVTNSVYNSMMLETDIGTVIYKLIVEIPGIIFKNFGYLTDTALISTFGIRDVVSVVVCFLLCFVVPILQIRKYKQESREVRFLIVFTIVHNIEMALLIAMLMGEHVHAYYYQSSIFLLILISTRYIYEYWIKKTDLNSILTVFCYTAIFLIYFMSLTYPNRSWKADLESQKSLCRTLEEHGLTKGYASFWNAYKYEIYSDLNIEFCGMPENDPEEPFDIYNNITPYYWLVDSNRYIPEEGKRTFLLLNEDENSRMQINPEERFGKIKDKFCVEDYMGKYYVYVWDYDIAERL